MDHHMNRFRYRVWDTSNRYMVYDPFRFDPVDDNIVAADERLNVPFTYDHTYGDYVDGIHRPCYVMQVLGLKDDNGKDVYEGDILAWSQSHGWEVGIIDHGLNVVTWDDDMLKWVFADPFSGERFDAVDCVVGVVAGNVYENRALLPRAEESSI